METCLLHSNDIKIPLVIPGFDISFIFRLEIVLKGACLFITLFSVGYRTENNLSTLGSLSEIKVCQSICNRSCKKFSSEKCELSRIEHLTFLPITVRKRTI